MAGYGKEKREQKLREAYAFGRTLLKASKGMVFGGFAHIINKNVYNPSWLKSSDWEKIAEMSEDEFVFYANKRKYSYDGNPFGEVKEMQINSTPIEDLLPGFENEPKPVQTAIDFDKERIADNLGQLIVEVRRIATALEMLASAMDSNGIFHVETH